MEPVVSEKIKKPERVFYKTSSRWYHRSEPEFYPPEEQPAARLLKENYPAIKKEIMDFYFEKADQLKPNFTPYEYRNTGWRTLNLYSYFYKQHDNIAKFPVIDSVVSQIPGMCTCQIALLKPDTRIKAHIGDTSAVIRHHLGIVVPGTLPDIGIKVGVHEQGWAEGEVFAICIAKRHFAWNYTDSFRIVLVVDVVREEYRKKQFWIASMTLAGVAIRVMGVKFPFLKHVPRFLSRFTQFCGAIAFRVVLWMQWKLGWKIEKLIH